MFDPQGPQHDWTHVAAALVRIKTELANPAASNITDIRAPYSIQYGLYQALGIPLAPYQMN